MIKLYSGNHEILSSGVALTFSGHDGFKFEIALADNFCINLSLDIEEDGGERDLIKQVNDNDIHITCRNFGVGAGTVIPMHVTKFADKNVYFHFALESVLSDNKVYGLTYAIFVGD